MGGSYPLVIVLVNDKLDKMASAPKKPYLRPPFSLAGLSLADMKRHPSLIPLFACLGAGCLWCAVFTFRSAAKHPDVTWNKWTHADGWEDYRKKNFKFFATAEHKESIKCEAPEYWK